MSTFVQGVGGVSGSGTTVAATLSGVVAHHNLRVAVETDTGTVSVSSVSDGTNTFNLVDALNNQAGRSFQTAYWPDSKSGSVTVTATFSGTSSFARIWVEEWSGDATTSALDGHNATFTASATSFPAGSLTTTNNGDDVWCVFWQPSGSVPTVGSGFTIVTSNGNSQGFYTEHQAQSSAGSINPNWTNAGTVTNVYVAAMAFKSPSSAPIGKLIDISQARARAAYW